MQKSRQVHSWWNWDRSHLSARISPPGTLHDYPAPAAAHQVVAPPWGTSARRRWVECHLDPNRRGVLDGCGLGLRREPLDERGVCDALAQRPAHGHELPEVSLAELHLVDAGFPGLCAKGAGGFGSSSAPRRSRSFAVEPRRS